MLNETRLGRLAGIADILTEKKKSKKVKAAKWTPAPEFFSNSSTEIVKGLLAAPGGHAKALSRLNTYITRAGDKLSDKDKSRLGDAKEKLAKKVASIQEEISETARRCGIFLERKKPDEDPDMNLPGDEEAPPEGDDAPPAKDGEEEASKSEDENELPKIVQRIAKKAVGKDEEELADLLMKVYDAGFKDGVKSTKEDEPKKDKKEDDAEAPAGDEGDEKKKKDE